MTPPDKDCLHPKKAQHTDPTNIARYGLLQALAWSLPRQPTPALATSPLARRPCVTMDPLEQGTSAAHA